MIIPILILGIIIFSFTLAALQKIDIIGIYDYIMWKLWKDFDRW